MVVYGWKPGEFISMDMKQKGLFLAYQEKMAKDNKWQEIMKLKIGVRL